MKIRFEDYNLEDFVVKEGLFCGHTAKLIIPSDLGCKFTQKNKIFRSSVWSLDGLLLSAGLPKFVNWGENPENFPPPTDLDKCTFLTKIDGSLMIVDYIDDQISMRTRGVFNYSSLDNSKDFDFILKKYPLIIPFIKDCKYLTLLFEIVTPNQRIVLNYGDEPDIYLIGAVYKDMDYELATQSLLDWIAVELKVKRPSYFKFPSFDEMLKSIEQNKEIEGICVYSSEDQQIHKCKTARYLALHRLKSQLSSLDKVIDLYLVQKRPVFDIFYNLILTTFDFEIAEISKENIKKCCELGMLAQKSLDEISQFVSTLDKSSRKDCALKIIDKYREKSLDSFAFSILNGKKIEDKDFKRLMENLNK